MSQKLPSEETEKELSWEEAVSRYLESSPDYFARHPDVLAALNVPHTGRAGAVSLIERQVQVLRDKGRALQRQLRELVSIARENDVLGGRLHRFALAMLDAGSVDEALSTAQDMLRQEFRLDAVAVRFRAPTADGPPEFAGADDERLAALLSQLGSGQPVCGSKYSEELLAYVFGDQAREIRSTALVPLTGGGLTGVLALGSRDPQRFYPGMGTVYLVRLGDLLLRVVLKHRAG